MVRQRALETLCLWPGTSVPGPSARHASSGKQPPHLQATASDPLHVDGHISRQ
jgi:hypothetical protein